MWGKASPPFLHATSLGFSLGALLGPLLASPFLLPVDRIAAPAGNLTTSAAPTPTTSPTSPAEPDLPLDIPLRTAIYISAGFCVLASALFSVVCLMRPANPPHPSRACKQRVSSAADADPDADAAAAAADDEKHGVTSAQLLRPAPPAGYELHKALLIAFGCFYIHTAHGLEVAMAGLLPIFAVQSALGMSKAAASVIVSVYWTCFTFARVLAVPLSVWLSPRQMIALDLVLVSCANALLLPLANQHEWALWTGVVIMGFGRTFRQAFELNLLHMNRFISNHE